MSVIDVILKTLRVGADINSSSLAVGRSALEVNAHLLRELPAGFDVFAFVSSVKAGGLMYFTDERLTLYRVHGENWTARPAKGEGKGAYLKLARNSFLAINVYRLISSRLLNDDINEYLCIERLNKGALQLLPLPELGALPPELRLSLSDIKLALRCYKIEVEDLLDVIFIMGNALLGPLLASPRGRLVVGKLLESVVEALTTKRALRDSLR